MKTMQQCNIVSNEQRAASVSDYETNCTRRRGRENAVMDTTRDDLNEARRADDGHQEVAESMHVDSDTTPSCRRSPSPAASPTAVSDGVVVSGRCDDDCLMDGVDDADAAPREPQVTGDVAATTATTTSVPLLEQLVSSPHEVVAPRPVGSAAPLTAVSLAADGQSSLDKSFLQKLEYFVSSVGQVVPTPLPRPPLIGWIRRPVFPSRSAAPSGGTASAKRQAPAVLSQHPILPPSSEPDSNRPLDLSARLVDSPVYVDETRPSSQHQHIQLMQHGSGRSGVDGRFLDVSEMQPNGANSLACLERDFGEHSAILSRLGPSRDRHRGVAAATGHRGRNAVLPGLIAGLTSPGERNCPPVSTPVAPVAPRPQLRFPPQSFVGPRRQPPPMNDRCSKLDSRHPTMLTTTAATALRCLQCGRTFFSLPELTLHMIQSAHYANLICAAAAYNADDEEENIVDAAYSRHQGSNVGADYSTHRSGALQLCRGKGTTEISDVRGRGRISGSEIRRADYLDAAVSPVRSLDDDDDESVSSAGMTETESLRSPTSTGSPTSSPSYERLSSGASDDDLTLMSHLLRLQPLLSRTVLDNRQTGPAVPGNVDWTAMGLAGAEECRRQLDRGRSWKIELDRSSAVDSLPIDLRSHGADANRYRSSHARPMPPAHAAKIPALTPLPASTVYLEKLLDDVQGCRKPLDAGVKRSALSKWHSSKHRIKKHQTCSVSSPPDCNHASYERPQLNGDRVAAAPTSSEACVEKLDDGGREFRPSIKTSSPANHEKQSPPRRQETAADCTRRTLSKNSAVASAVIGVGPADSPSLSVHRGRDADVPTAAAVRRSGTNKDQSEYAARFGKYYRLAQELSSKSE